MASSSITEQSALVSLSDHEENLQTHLSAYAQVSAQSETSRWQCAIARDDFAVGL
jgi:hypothetical protein